MQGLNKDRITIACTEKGHLSHYTALPGSKYACGEMHQFEVILKLNKEV